MNSGRFGVAAALAAAGLFVMALPYYITPICTGGMETKMGMMTHHACFYTARAGILIGALAFVAGIGFAVKDLGMNGRALAVFVIPLGLATLALPRYILPICQSAHMECQQNGVALGWTAAGVVMIALGVVAAALRSET